MKTMARKISSVVFTATCAVSAACAEKPQKYLGSTWQGAPDPLLGALFNQATTENCGKWGEVEKKRGERNWAPADALVAHAEKHGMLVKYHCFVWGMQQPAWTKTAPDIQTALEEFMSDAFARYGGKIHMFDVVNEPLSQPAKYRGQLGGAGETGWDWVVWPFVRARALAQKHNCKAELILNEWGLLADDGKLKRFCGIVSVLKERGLIDAVGEQAHFLEGVSVSDARRRLDMLSSNTGLPIHISEFDVDIADDQKHLERFSELFKVFWEHPSVKGVTFWGYREGRIWRKNAFLIRKDGTERPALAWLRAYLKEHGRE